MRKTLCAITLLLFLIVILESPVLAQKPGYRYEYENQYDEEGNIISTTRKSVKIEQGVITDILDDDGNVTGTMRVIERPDGTVIGSSAEFTVERVYDEQPHTRTRLSNYSALTPNGFHNLSGNHAEAILRLYEFSMIDFPASYSYANQPLYDRDYFTFSDGSLPNYIIDGNSESSFIRSLWHNLF